MSRNAFPGQPEMSITFDHPYLDPEMVLKVEQAPGGYDLILYDQEENLVGTPINCVPIPSLDEALKLAEQAVRIIFITGNAQKLAPEEALALRISMRRVDPDHYQLVEEEVSAQVVGSLQERGLIERMGDYYWATAIGKEVRKEVLDYTPAP